MTKREVRARRGARIALPTGPAGQTSGETVAAALARKRRQTGDAEAHERSVGRYAGIAVTAGRLLWTAAVGADMPAPALRDFRRALTAFTEDPPVMPAELTARTVHTELGGPPHEVFAEFDPAPFATGPVCQVHAAVLPDGRRVAVKIRYRGAAQALRTLLAGDEVRAALTPPLLAVAPATAADLRHTASELRGRVEESIGLRAEAALQTEFATAYAGHPFVRIPGVVPELSTQRVLTMARADGIGWADAVRSDAAARDHWGEVIYRFRTGSAHELGMTCADHSGHGNHVFHDDGTVTFLGFGRVRRVGAADESTVDVETGTLALLDALGATADWSAIRRERDGGDPPATVLGKLELAWKAARMGETDDH